VEEAFASSPSSSSTLIDINECPTKQTSSGLTFISMTVPSAADGILATSLSVNTSTRSSNWKLKRRQINIKKWESWIFKLKIDYDLNTA
jgi:hypothetical protein